MEDKFVYLLFLFLYYVVNNLLFQMNVVIIQ